MLRYNGNSSAWVNTFEDHHYVLQHYILCDHIDHKYLAKTGENSKPERKNFVKMYEIFKGLAECSLSPLLKNEK